MEGRLTGINRKETLQYLGYLGSEIPEQLEQDLTRCEEEILRTARPRVLWKLFSLEQDGRFAGTAFSPRGHDVQKLLKDCNQVIRIAVTLGSET